MRGIAEVMEASQAVIPIGDAVEKDGKLDQMAAGILPSGENVLIVYTEDS